MWNFFERLFKRQEGSKEFWQDPDLKVGWLDPENNLWTVPVIDVRPVTLSLLSATTNPNFAANAVSFGGDDGTSFIGIAPPVSRTVPAGLRFRIDKILADGQLFIPNKMEQKWALYYHQGQIICIRSWRRQVQAVADVHVDSEYATITAIHGTFLEEGEEPEFTVRVLDFLLRSHALNLVYPAPLPEGIEKNLPGAARWCYSVFGNLAQVATPHVLSDDPPDLPLRTNSMLHLAVAEGDVDAFTGCLNRGVPIDLLCNRGLSPLHWSVVGEDMKMTRLLLDRGSPVDVRSMEGATPLMNAVQAGSADKATLLLDHAADTNATDNRGFTPLHRAAELGHKELVELLLKRGASPNPVAEGHTPQSLAEAGEHSAIIKLLDTG